MVELVNIQYGYEVFQDLLLQHIKYVTFINDLKARVKKHHFYQRTILARSFHPSSV